MYDSLTAVSTDICMLENCSRKRARSKKELDQLQCRRKKIKTIVKESDRNSVDVVMETQIDLQPIEGNKIQDVQTTAPPFTIVIQRYFKE